MGRNTRRTRKARRNNSQQKPKLKRGIAKRNVTKHITITRNKNKEYGYAGKKIIKHGYRRPREILSEANSNNMLHAENLVASRIGDPQRTPTVVQNVGLTPEESQKYADFYHNYVLNNSANADQNFLFSINADSSLTKNTKSKLTKHFLASLETGSELNKKVGISKIYNAANHLYNYPNNYAEQQV